MNDDRGRPVEVMRRAGFCPWPLSGDERIGHLLRRMSVAVNRGGARWRMVFILTLVPLLALGMGLAMPKLLRLMPGFPAWVPIGLMAGTIAITVRSLLWWRVHSQRARVLDVVLEEGLCGSCGYNLVGLPEEPDGMLVCPECSAAWKRARVKTRAAFVADARMGDPWSVLGRRRARPVIPMKDDRGREVEGVPPRLRAAVRGARPFPERHERLRRAQRRILRAGRWVRWLIIGLMGAVVVGAPTALYILTRGAGPWWTPLLMAPALLPMGILLWRGRIGFRAAAVKQALLAEGMCPSCAGELAGAAGDDGCVECGMCRSAWRRPDQADSVRPLS